MNELLSDLRVKIPGFVGMLGAPIAAVCVYRMRRAGILRDARAWVRLALLMLGLLLGLVFAYMPRKLGDAWTVSGVPTPTGASVRLMDQWYLQVFPLGWPVDILWGVFVVHVIAWSFVKMAGPRGVGLGTRMP